ncbi:MAG: TolC family protein [Rhodocyclaceae bacterium]
MTARRAPKLALKPLAVLTVAIALTGCAISPTPITLDERQTDVRAERADLFKNQEPVAGPIALDEAMARAVKYNLDFRLKQMEEALAQRQLDLANFDLLPKLTAAAGYSNRSNQNASSSYSVITGQQSLEPSVSSDDEGSTASLTLSWNILDFGVSYFQAKQQADRALVAQERRRKTIHLVMQQVRQAYWQAAGAQALEGKIGPVLEQARAALADSRKIEAEKLQSPLETLNYQRQLLDIIRQLEAINDELSQAKPKLASLMNLEPGKSYQLAMPGDLGTPAISMPLDRMEETALLNRPELMEARYNERISLNETRKAIARLLPGIQFDIGDNYDSNSFLVNNEWRSAGVRVSWNLLGVFNARSVLQAADAQSEIARNQKLAMSMAVLTQTQVAYRDYLGRKRQFELSSDLDGVERRILDHTRNAARNDAQGKLAEIRAAASSLMSELRRYQSYGALQGAYGQVLATLGLDPLPKGVPNYDLSTLTQAIQSMESRWDDTVSKDGKAG